jgi:hypothetical protein
MASSIAVHSKKEHVSQSDVSQDAGRAPFKNLIEPSHSTVLFHKESFIHGTSLEGGGLEKNPT